MQKQTIGLTFIAAEMDAISIMLFLHEDQWVIQCTFY